MNHLSEEEKTRREKLNFYREQSVNPYRNGLMPKNSIREIREKWGEYTKEQLEAEKISVTYAGRIMAFRHFGKAAFVQIKDREGKLQSYVAIDAIGADSFAIFKTFDVGDIVFVEGHLFRTKTNELSVHADKISLLTKSLRPLPEKFHGLTDVEQKYRMRYVDLIMNDEVRDVFKVRSKVIQYIREYLSKRDFFEVETPMMHPIAGGAAARPFTTHHNTLDMQLFLRIAPELYLKRLLVGGMEKVFEINRNFRNEGISIRHNPEFTMLEFYWAYATFEDLIALTEDMIEGLAKEVTGSNEITYQGEKISFAKPWKRYSVKESIQKLSGLDADLITDKALSTIEGVQAALLKAGDYKKNWKPHWGHGAYLTHLFETAVEKKLIQPTFITDYPAEVSFLARRNEKNPEVTDRFELFVFGRELANAFSELNDPIDQRERFESQAKNKAQGDDEACEVDEDFLKALEYGMPPAAGQGIGIDRLVMFLTDQASIRDVILFPQLRPES
ncbi:MAG: lysine--tRNA ligase [Oligoflexia bacterium]|nr:lysine--tRNA ligase [Oligoflexia bacterium]